MDDEKRSDSWEAARSRHAQRYHSGTRTDPWGRRFVVAMSILLAVVIIYPWYERWVDSYIASRFLESLGEEFERAEEDVQQQTRALSKQSAQAAKASRREQQRLRVARVKLKGATDGSNGPVVIVDLGNATLVESGATICKQASAWLRKDLANVSLRVQRYRSSQPAIDEGVVNCR